jgi:hypothetical protein
VYVPESANDTGKGCGPKQASRNAAATSGGARNMIGCSMTEFKLKNLLLNKFFFFN